MIAGKSDKVFLLHILDFSGMAGQMWKKGTATHSSIFAWRIPWKGAWWAAVHRVTQSQTRPK